MRIYRKTQMRLGDGTVVGRKAPVLVPQLTELEQQEYRHARACRRVPSHLGPTTMEKFLDVDGTLYLGAEGSPICEARRTWLT